MKPIQRIHHVSALGGQAQETVDFYRDVLKVKLIKATVDFAAGETYHLFFANGGQESKAAMTYFDWGHKQKGHKGGGQVGQTAFRIPIDSMDEWEKDLEGHRIQTKRSQKFGQESLEFQDGSGIDLALVEGSQEHDSIDIYDFHGVEMLSTDYQATAHHLDQFLGLHKAGVSSSHLFFDTRGQEKHRVIVPQQNIQRRGFGQGTVDHVAFQVTDKSELDDWRDQLTDHGFENTDLTGQNFKKATYYLEPGQVRIELATQGLGMMTDLESHGQLGQEVVIPGHLKDREEEILQHLTPLNL